MSTMIPPPPSTPEHGLLDDLGHALSAGTDVAISVPHEALLGESMSTMQTQPIEDAAPMIELPHSHMLMDSMSTMQTQPTD